MNTYALVILVAILAQNALALAADLLNLRALRPELPAGFESVYDAERYRRSQEYTRARTRFSFVPQAVDLVRCSASGSWGASPGSTAGRVGSRSGRSGRGSSSSACCSSPSRSSFTGR
jgi:hypothetical protein